MVLFRGGRVSLYYSGASKDEHDNGRTKAEIVKQNIVYETWTPFAEEKKQKAQLKCE
jgi:hypothetical protein